jgi:hypothetical protein
MSRTQLKSQQKLATSFSLGFTTYLAPLDKYITLWLTRQTYHCACASPHTLLVMNSETDGLQQEYTMNTQIHTAVQLGIHELKRPPRMVCVGFVCPIHTCDTTIWIHRVLQMHAAFEYFSTRSWCYISFISQESSNAKGIASPLCLIPDCCD